MVHRWKVLTTLTSLLAFNGVIGMAHAQVPPGPPVIPLPMVGIGFGQTYQLNVVAFNPCLWQLAILDSNGTPVKQMIPGNAKFGSITFDHGVSSFPQRKQLHGVVTVQPTTTSPCLAQATVEVYDDLTRTDWVLTPGLQPPGPPYFGPFGLTFEQTARLNVVAHPPDPCIGTIGFIDTSGNPIGTQMPVNLAPNQATFVDLPGFQAGTALNSQRPEVIGVLQPPGPATVPTPNACIASVEVFDRFTGYTRVFQPPGPSVFPAAITVPTGSTQ